MRILGKNIRYYPEEEGIEGRMEEGVVVALVEGSIGDYAAYAGIGSDEWVAHYGDKLSFDEAHIHFPSIVRERYRT